ncbi:MAG: hypothetical protein M3Y18_03250 [Candidatus Eremiobacteraeota bacterium]|nr:hypothetical protein [Candidatus Eremiobacteraeota bacterium]
MSMRRKRLSAAAGSPPTMSREEILAVIDACAAALTLHQVAAWFAAAFPADH